MELELKTRLQCEIADKLWNAEDQDEVDEILSQYGVEAEVIMELMIAQDLDSENGTDLAQDVLKKFLLP
jgi:hypothetical protein